MDRDSPAASRIIALVTLGSLFPIFLVRLSGIESTIFWVYSICMTSFLLLTFFATNDYRPIPDVGYRPSVSVIIPVKNEEKVIGNVVRTVFKSDYPSFKLDVIVIDDGSTDGTWNQLQDLKNCGFDDRLALVRHETNYGKRVALASGIGKAKGDIIVCIDSDSFVDRDAIRLLVQPFTDRNVVAVSGHGEAANANEGVLTKLQHYWYVVMFRLMKGMESRFGMVSCCSGILAAYRKTCVLPILNEWLNEKFIGKPILIGDDRQLTNLVLRGFNGRGANSSDNFLTDYMPSVKKAKVVYQSNAIVYTIVPTDFKGFLKQQLRWKRSWVHGSLLAGRFMWRKPVPIAFLFYLYQFLTFMSPIITIVWVIVRPLQGNALGTFGFLAGSLYIGFLSGLNVWKFQRTTKEAIPYSTAFVFMSLFISLTLLLYGWSTPWKGGWITRSDLKSPAVEPIPLTAIPSVR